MSPAPGSTTADCEHCSTANSTGSMSLTLRSHRRRSLVSIGVYREAVSSPKNTEFDVIFPSRRVPPRSHRRRFVPDCDNFKIATKSQFIVTILVCPSSSWKQIGNQNLSGRKFQHVQFFLPILQCHDLIRNRLYRCSSVFVLVCPSLS